MLRGAFSASLTTITNNVGAASAKRIMQRRTGLRIPQASNRPREHQRRDNDAARFPVLPGAFRAKADHRGVLKSDSWKNIRLTVYDERG